MAAKRKGLRGQIALALNATAMFIGGTGSSRGGYAAAKRNTRHTRGWLPGEGSPASDILPDLPVLRGRSRDLDRNNPLARGATITKVHGVVGSGLKLRSVVDKDVLGLSDEQARQAQKTIEAEWAIFEAECDFSALQHLQDEQRMIYRSARISGDVGVARRFKKRPGNTYGTKIVVIEADRISNPQRRPDSDTLQGGVEKTAEGEIVAVWVTDRHPGDLSGKALKWDRIPLRGPTSGIRQFLLAVDVERPGQVRGVPLFAPIEEALKQLGDYHGAELKAAINDAYLFATEEYAADVDEEGNPIVKRADGETDDDGELTLEDLTITELPHGAKLNVKKPERPNTAFDGFVMAFCRYVGAALGLPYEVLVQQFGQSFSASRGALEIAYKGFLVDRAWLIRTIIDPVREWQFTEMVAAGRFSAPGYFDDPILRQAWLGREWIGPTRIQIDPGKEAKADETDIKNAVKTRQQVMTERTGGDFDTKSAQWRGERDALAQGSDAAQGDNKD